MAVLVTGGAGFIGSHVAEALVARGEDVVVLDDLSSGKRENLPDGRRLRRGRRPRAAGRALRGRQADGLLPPRGADRRAGLGRPARSRRAHQRPRDGQRPPGGARARDAGRLQLHGRRDLRRVRPARLGGRASAADRALRDGEARRRGVPGDVQPAARDAARLAALRERLRAAAGPARRGGRRRDLLQQAARGRAAEGLRRRLGRRGTTCTSETSRARRWRPAGTTAASSTSAPAARRRSSSCSSCASGSRARASSRSSSPPRPGELQRSVLDPSRAVDELGWRPERSLEDGLRETWEFFRG